MNVGELCCLVCLCVQIPILVSCGQSSSTCPGGYGSGQVIVNVTSSVPLPAQPGIQLVGNYFDEPTDLAVGAPVTLPAGPYVVQGKRVKSAAGSGEIAGIAYYATMNDISICVRAGETTTVPMAYDRDPGSGRLWVTTASSSDSSRVMIAYDSADLVISGSPAPAVSVKSDPAVGRAAAFDYEGNLLISGTPSIDDVLKWRADRLGAAVTSPPDIEVGLHGTIPSTMAFDAAGNLWIGDVTNTITGVLRSALVSGGVTQDVIYLGTSIFAGASGMAFDEGGNLWTARGGDSVYQFASTVLSKSSGDPPEAVALSASSYGTGDPQLGAQSMAFDAQGNLWVGYASGNHIVRFTPEDQAAGGLIAASLDIVPSGGASLTSLAFDETGGLWYPVGFGQIARIPAAMLVGGSGGALSVTPDIVITGGDEMGLPVSLILDPAPSGSPINDATP